ncbi:hypothetical protein GCM10007940_30030 [Portibacter lacus]|uniref:Uncharacterized protein n=2 Tax=Portibacter lacus TaxID=1099794 RepID=A0AA37WFB7_9BACT|nr:hypothetical protein GCM10007940_30030 [Portibacter lacus]
MHNFNLQTSFLIEIPGADLADRYGANNKFEFKLEYASPSLLAYYIKAGLRINQNVREDVLASLRTSDGFLIGVNGFYADVFGRQRGYDIGIGIDKLISIKKQYLRIGLGTSYITHFVKLVDDSQSIPQIIGDSGHYFDRFTSGFGLEENIQYQYNYNNNRAGFIFGFQFGQFFTKEHRYKLLPTGTPERRIDLFFGIKATYLMPIYTFEKGQTIYY